MFSLARVQGGRFREVSDSRGLERLTKGKPKTIEILDDEFPHSVFSCVRRFHDVSLLGNYLKALIDVIDVHIKIDVSSR